MGKRIGAGTLTKEHVGKEVVLKGWVHRRRDLGELIFIDLRDQSGIVQLVFNPDYSREALEIADKLRSEFVIEVHGKVIERDPETVNPNLKTGDIEVTVSEVNILNRSKPIPFLIHEQITVLDLSSLKEYFNNGVWNESTLTFNNLINVKGQLTTDWIKPAGETWLKRYLPKETVKS